VVSFFVSSPPSARRFRIAAQCSNLTGTASSRFPRIRAFVACWTPRVIALAQRYPGVLALFGLVSGLISFFTVDRHEGFARGIAVVMVVSWLWLVLEKTVSQRVADRFGVSLPTPVLRYVTQMIHQESFFFVLPFLYAATTWNSGQALFTGLLGAAALVALIDPLYYRWLAKQRWVFLTYHTLSLFAVLLTALPLLFNLRTGESYRLALGVAVVLAFPTLAGLITLQTWTRRIAVVALMAALAGGGWFARVWVPPATLRLSDAALALRLDTGNPTPEKRLKEVTVAQLRAGGLYAYTAVAAPLGLKEHIYHVWRHEGREVDRIAIDIRGGRKEGYRAWTHKVNFPPNPAGRWEVRVLTDAGQMIGVMRFEAIAEGGP
jgi:hypothetical protein